MANIIAIPESKPTKTTNLKIDGDNPNIMTKSQKKALRKNIEKYGFLIPIITNKDYLVADGHQRLEVAKEAGWKEVPVIRLDIEDVDRRIIRQVMNKLRGTHDLELDTSEYVKINDDGGLISMAELLDDKTDSFMKLIKKDNDAVEDDFEIPKEAKYNVELGDVYTLGNHRLMCGDATKGEDVDKLLQGEKVDMVFTDPPYNTGMNKKTNSGSTWLSHMFNDSYTNEEWNNLLKKTFTNYYNSMKDNTALYTCFGWKRNHELIPHLKRFHIENIIVWDKIVHGLGSSYQYTYELINVCKKGKPKLNTHQGEREYCDVWHIQRKVGRNEDHATAKPIELCARAIRHASNTDQIVLDLFGGSGSTLIACEQLNRKCYMMELDPYYCSVIIERWEKVTGKKAEKVML